LRVCVRTTGAPIRLEVGRYNLLLSQDGKMVHCDSGLSSLLGCFSCQRS
jgi:hypothetical protein